MVTIASLWLPIVLSAVFVWIGSALVWMVLPHHKSDYRKMPDEEAARNGIGQGIEPGQYNIPHVVDWDEMKTPEGQKKFTDGPVGFLTILPRAIPNMGKNMALSFLFYLVVGVVVAYVAGRTTAADADYLSVFRISGTAAFLAYGFATVQDAVWFGRPWSQIVKILFDALFYALLTAGTFGWLWPN